MSCKPSPPLSLKGSVTGWYWFRHCYFLLMWLWAGDTLSVPLVPQLGTVMNIGVQISFELEFSPFPDTCPWPRSVITGSYGSSILSFKRNLLAVLHSGCYQFTFPPAVYEGTLSSKCSPELVNKIFFSPVYFIVRIQYIIHIIYKICVNQLFVLLVRFLVNSRLLEVKFWGSKVICRFLTVWGLASLTPMLFRSQLYRNTIGYRFSKGRNFSFVH